MLWKNQNKFLVQSPCLGNFCFKWTIVWRTTQINICWHSPPCWLWRKYLKKFDYVFNLVIGHTHETLMDVLNICPKSLRNKTTISINLMKAFMVFQDWPFILQLIQEIPNLESWVVSCLKDGHETLLGHMDMHLFIFFIELFRWLVM